MRSFGIVDNISSTTPANYPGAGDYRRWQDTVYPYIKSAGVFQCPDSTNKFVVSPTAANR